MNKTANWKTKLCHSRDQVLQKVCIISGCDGSSNITWSTCSLQRSWLGREGSWGNVSMAQELTRQQVLADWRSWQEGKSSCWHHMLLSFAQNCHWHWGRERKDWTQMYNHRQNKNSWTKIEHNQAIATLTCHVRVPMNYSLQSKLVMYATLSITLSITLTAFCFLPAHHAPVHGSRTHGALTRREICLFPPLSGPGREKQRHRQDGLAD